MNGTSGAPKRHGKRPKTTLTDWFIVAVMVGLIIALISVGIYFIPVP